MIAFDIGLKRIGIAQNRLGIAIPLKPIIRKNRNQAANELKKIIQDLDPKTIIIGIPKNGNSEVEMTQRIKYFVSLLNISSNIKTIYVDESFSTFEAEERIKDTKKNRKNGTIDSIAASIILERYLMSQK